MFMQTTNFFLYKSVFSNQRLRCSQLRLVGFCKIYVFNYLDSEPICVQGCPHKKSSFRELKEYNSLISKWIISLLMVFSIGMMTVLFTQRLVSDLFTLILINFHIDFEIITFIPIYECVNLEFITAVSILCQLPCD